MKKQSKFLIKIFVVLSILLLTIQTFTNYTQANFAYDYKALEYSQEYLDYLELDEEEKAKVIMPRMYTISKASKAIKNPLRLARLLGDSIENEPYSLKNIIPANMKIKDQQTTGSCWTFGSLAALESNLALQDYKQNKDVVVYDFSERHMEYATSQSFLDDQTDLKTTNEKGFNREVGDGGGSYLYLPYLTNGTGAIAESEMEFENNENPIYISELANKEPITQVNDVITFPQYTASDDKTQIKQQMKEHIKNYGAIEAGIHGAEILSDVYNNETGALYCNSSFSYGINHSIAIVGWDDTFSKTKFKTQPSQNGAWIIKNSWGTEISEDLSELKETLYSENTSDFNDLGYNSATEIPNDFLIEFYEETFGEGKVTINETTDIISIEIGDKGFMYVSYEDVNIYSQMTGIVSAQSNIDYDNIYQYDYFGGVMSGFSLGASKMYLATVFNRNTSATEYLTQVSIYVPQETNCKVYVNPNGSNKSNNDFQAVELKAGASETISAGYHTLEFKEPLKLNSSSFVVKLEMTATVDSSIDIMTESKNEIDIYDNVIVETGKCFYATEQALTTNQWSDAGTLYTDSNGVVNNGDTTIKAFTTTNILESISITNPPTKTTYFVSEDFDSTGMVVKANYTTETPKTITDYTITNGTDLGLGQTSVTISYKGKKATQAISVVENTVEKIEITTPPTNTTYWAGDKFDATGMSIKVTYKDGSTKQITEGFNVTDGDVLKNGQTTVTIEYEGLTVTQAITVKANPIVELKITKVPNKIKYIVGQSFDSTGMIVKAVYENKAEKEVTGYKINNGTSLQEGQTTVTIEYEGVTVTQAITVEVKSITSISLKNMPTKTKYVQNKEQLDLTGGSIEITYNDASKEEMSMTSKEIKVTGFDNTKAGKITLTLTYQTYTLTFDVEIEAEAKPENSDFNNLKANIVGIKAHVSTDKNDESYEIITVALSGIKKSNVNDKVEYYYYLSASSKEENIAEWNKISDFKTESDKMIFDIDTLKLSNDEELTMAENLYIYVKEVATRNNIKSEYITTSVLLEMNLDEILGEGYVDDEKEVEIEAGKIENSESNNNDGNSNNNNTVEDDTIANVEIPKAGKSLLILFVLAIMFIIGRISYVRYKDIQVK